MEIIFFGIILGIVVAIIAASKGFNAGGWFFYGFLIFPVALVHVLVKPRTVKSETARAVDAGLCPCPNCAEPIRPEAKVCRYCSRDLPVGWSAQTRRAPAQTAAGKPLGTTPPEPAAQRKPIMYP